MLAKDFKANVKVGSKIKTNGNTFVCTSVSGGFIYNFKNVDSSSDCALFSVCGITDGSVKDIEMGGID